MFGAVQPIYTARPVFLGGVPDPIPEPWGEVPGDHRDVVVPPPEALAPPAKQGRAVRDPGQPPTPTEPREPMSDEAVEAELARCIARVKAARNPLQRSTLRAAAVSLGGIQVEAGLTEGELTDWLLDALHAPTVADWNVARDTIAWGLANGRARPWNPGASTKQTLTQEEWEKTGPQWESRPTGANLPPPVLEASHKTITESARSRYILL